MVRKVLVAVALSSMLVGCGFTKQDPEVMRQQAASAHSQRVACEQRKEVEAREEAKMVASLSESAQTTYMALKAQSKTVSAATGHKVDECDVGTNINDVLITEIKEKNESVRSVGGKIVDKGVWGYLGGKALDTLDNANKNAGNHTNTTNSGDGSSSQHEHNQVTSNTTQETSADGEGSSNVTTAPPVTGPDKSSTSETINEAPPVAEEPVVVEE